MSLNAAMDRSAEHVAKLPRLETADQYLAWKTRVYDNCWAITGHDLAETTDTECLKAVVAAADVKDPPLVSAMIGFLHCWLIITNCWLIITNCWLIITNSLHDDLLLKLTTKRGMLASLL